jgi:2-polyprenyl-3-methyl-5-hydroxy-6-metoxy-1,4-benzoquinol methylase
MTMTNAETQRNLDHYGELTAGRSDYWRLMAAPRARVDAILRILRDASPASVLDLGCGDGSLLVAIARALPRAKLMGLDLSEAQIAANRERDPDIAWYAGNIEESGFQLPEATDAIVSSEVIEHLAEPLGFLRALCGLARPGALLVLSTQSGRVNETERRVGHVRHFTAAALREMLTAAGWEPVRVWNEGFPFHDLSKRVANLRPGSAMRQFGERPYGPAQRFVAWTLRVLFRLNSRARGAQLYAVARKPDAAGPRAAAQSR